jgi:DNA invertase Pin-like site-specific DNA recombinase
MTVLGIDTRLSRDETGAQTATARQEESCRLFARLRGWDVGEVFEDVDVSAYRNVRRPAYERMLEAVASKAIDGVLVWKIDRLVRRPAEFERAWAVTEEAGASLASVNDPIDTSTDIGLAIVRILVTFAGLESATTSLSTWGCQAELTPGCSSDLARAGGT